MKPDLQRIPEWYHGYISKVKEETLAAAFRRQTAAFIDFLKNIPETKTTCSYAPGKWTIRQLLQHIIDAERIFAYRALRFARKDNTPLPGFDENAYADNASAQLRNWADMIEEFSHVRRSTEILFDSFGEEELDATGNASGNPVYVLGIGYIISGHVQHHWDIMKERYLS